METMRKIFLIIGIFSLIFAQVCLASPLTLINPTNGESDVPVDDYFQWGEVAGTAKYILDIDQFTQSEDNILPSVCHGGICSFGFLDLTVGSINYLTAYTWRITAYDAAGNPIDSSPTFSFTTEQAPAPPLPPCPYTCRTGSDCESEGGACVDGSYEPCPSETPCCCQVGGPGPGGPISLINPLKATTLWEAINALINFLVLLAFAIAPILIIYAAFLILTAAGKAEQINKAKTIIFLTLIALAIILLAKGLPSIIKGAVGG